MKLLEALAESNFKIYTNYECNYELILQILSYYNVIAEILVKKKDLKKKKIITIVNTQTLMHTLNFYMHTLNFFSQQMLLHPLKHFPTNVAASIEMENNGSFEMQNLKSGQKWQKEVILAITSNCQNYLFLPLSDTINLFNSLFFNRACSNYLHNQQLFLLNNSMPTNKMQ